jgi:hypothetical protein
MSTTDTKRQLNAEYLSRARTMTQHILRDPSGWDRSTSTRSAIWPRLAATCKSPDERMQSAYSRAFYCGHEPPELFLC